MHVEFLPTDLSGKIGRVVEECGEVISAAGKTLRFGLQSVNPLLPEAERVRNVDWLRAEMNDLKHAMEKLDEELAAHA